MNRTALLALCRFLWLNLMQPVATAEKVSARSETQEEVAIQARNQCHEVTDHGFNRIMAEPGPNPYNQRFDVP